MEVITDSQFETLGRPDSPWHIEAHSVAGIAAQGVDGVCCLEVASPHEVFAHAEFRYAPFRVLRGQVAVIRFDAYAHEEMPFALSLSEYHEPNRCLCAPREKIAEWHLRPEWHHYEHACHIIHDEPEARLNFSFGARENHIFLARISLDLLVPEEVAA